MSINNNYSFKVEVTFTPYQLKLFNKQSRSSLMCPTGMMGVVFLNPQHNRRAICYMVISHLRTQHSSLFSYKHSFR